MTLHVLIINWNAKNDSITCINSVLKSKFENWQIHLLDNNSDNNELEEIKKIFKDEKRIKVYQSDKNLGFAGGNNFLLKKIIPECKKEDCILFLNNDTEIEADLFEKLSAAVDKEEKQEMIAARIMQFDDRKKIDSLGISVCKGGLGKNRIDSKEKLFAACGACSLYTVNCLKEIHKASGHYFDESYFCYAEDIDLGWRGLLLGYTPFLENSAICYHKGGASSGKGFNKFVMFHTLRNSLFNIVKNMPIRTLIKYLPKIIFLQIALLIRYLPSKKFPKVLKADFSFIKNIPKLIKKRKKIMKSMKINNKELEKYFSKKLLCK